MGRQTILVVDDDTAVREAVAHAIEVGGYRVIAAGDGAEALEVLAERSGEIALVVLDVLMPRMCAAEVLTHLTRINASVRVLLVSGHCPAAQEHAILNPCVLGFLAKPFSVRQLLDAIGGILRHHPD